MAGTKIMVARKSDGNSFMEYGTVEETDLDRLHEMAGKIAHALKEESRFRLIQDGKCVDDFWK